MVDFDFRIGVNAPCLTLDTAGDATFSGDVTVGNNFVCTGARIGWGHDSAGFGWLKTTEENISEPDSLLMGYKLNTGQTAVEKLEIPHDLYCFKNIYKQGGTPVTTTRDLIETLSTLREATKDETTVKGLRDAIGNAVGGLIEKFEAMQAEEADE